MHPQLDFTTDSVLCTYESGREEEGHQVDITSLRVL